MPAYFASDLHLRPDRPDRGARLARFVAGLGPDDRLTLVGDVCDFWFASRQRPRGDEPLSCPGLRALADFRRRGGALTILPGNHDAWLGPFYERALGARYLPVEGLDVVEYGLRLHLLHGHRIGARKLWKGPMESRAFLRAFGSLPEALAAGLEAQLDRNKAATRAASDRRFLAVFRRYAETRADSADLVVFGHIHRALDLADARPRLVVLGDWMTGASYLRIDRDGARIGIEPAGSAASDLDKRAPAPVP